MEQWIQPAISSCSRDSWTLSTTIESTEPGYLISVSDLIVVFQLFLGLSEEVSNFSFNLLILPI